MDLLVLLYLLVVGAFGLEIFIYPGLTENYLGLDPFWLFYLFAGWVVVKLVFSPIKRLRHKFFSELRQLAFHLNRNLVLPLSLVLLVFFTILEHLNYDNYVFQTFGVYHPYLLIVFLSAYGAYVAHLGKKHILSKPKAHIFGLSAVMFVMMAFFFTWPHDFFVEVSKEDGIFENLQFVLFLGASFLFGKIGWRHWKLKNTILAIIFLIGALLWLVVAAEEISWGQRIFGLEIESIQETSTKDEINIHNQKAIQEFVHPAYRMVAIYGMVSFFVYRLFLRRRWPDARWLTPGPEFFLYFLGLYLAYTVFQAAPLPEFRIYFEESAELLLAVAVFLFGLQKLRQVNKLSKTSDNTQRSASSPRQNQS